MRDVAVFALTGITIVAAVLTSNYLVEVLRSLLRREELPRLRAPTQEQEKSRDKGRRKVAVH